MHGSDKSAWRADDWTTWFLSSRPFMLADVVDLYAGAEPEMRQQISRGLIDAIRSWEEDFHGLIALHWLARTSGALRVAGAIPSLIRILLLHRARMQWTDPFFGTADTILSVLTGFAPDAEIERAFRALIFDDDVAPQFAGLLAVGISICDAKRFPEAFDRFVELQAKVPSYFDGPSVVTELVRHLTMPAIADSMSALSPAAHDYFVTSATSAGILTASQLVGFDHGLRHGGEPLPLAATDVRTLYERAGARYDLAAKVMRQHGASILDDLYTRMK
ncbi:MAG TPA: hypothetical protein VHK90_13925 [Thermoanaerobaculia bacterium]|nr:hypothetical protein [Thermoanaerobaculia bacterium]